MGILQMKKCIFTVCTADYFQFYIPIFIWSALDVYKNVDVVIYLRGKLDSTVATALSFIDISRVKIVENYKTGYPNLPSTTNCLRFTTAPIDYDEVFVTDVDMFFNKTRQGIFYHCRQVKNNDSYVGYHSPWKKPHRPEICESWRGEFERIAAGFVMLYRPWWNDTKKIREEYNSLLLNGKWGSFRESDEVMLSRMVKHAGLPMVPSVPLPRFLRPLHLGDFKPSMQHRYTNKQKMRAFMDKECVNSFLRAKSDRTFSSILRIISKNAQMKEIIGNVSEYCEKRSRGEM
jgi:hypothetical protein